MSKTILVTGGAGYIGSQTNLSLLEAGYKIIIFDNLAYGHKEVIPDDSIFVEGDLNNVGDIKKVFREHQIDGVIHFAAYAYVGESVTDPAKYYQNNIGGTLNLLVAMIEAKVLNIVFSSTCATYGIPTSSPITENNKQEPINPYGYTKLVVENMLKDFQTAYKLNSIALRYFNACGADSKLRTGESHDPETHLIPLILDVASGKRESIAIFGTDYNTPDGTCVRDYIHTQDLASAHILALEKLMNNEIRCDQINLGTGTGFSVLEIINSAKAVTGKDIKIVLGARRTGDPDILVADNSKARKVLGWKPSNSSLENIITSAWQWHLK